MSATGAGYDLSNTTYSPDGRVFQVEYAQKAVETSGVAIGIRCADGVVLGVRKDIKHRLLVPSSSKRVSAIDYHAGIATAGILGDSRRLSIVAADEASEYKSFYGSSIPGRMLASRVAGEVHTHTIYWWVRPFGASALLSCFDEEEGPSLHVIEPTGEFFRYRAGAVGLGMAAAKSELERLDFDAITAREAVFEIARIIYKLDEGSNDDEFEIEFGWVCEESDRRHIAVPKDLVAEAVERAIEIRDADDLDSDDDDDN